jgi:hypothetical protein
MPKHDHHKAAAHHEEAAKSHRNAAAAHEEGDTEGEPAFADSKRSFQ